MEKTVPKKGFEKNQGPITRELVKVQDGTIEVASTIGRGSRFTVRFPRLHDEQTLPGAERLEASFETEGGRE